MTTVAYTGTSFTTTIRYAKGMAFDGTHLWVCDYFNHQIEKITTDGVSAGQWPVGGDSTNPQGLVVFDGHLWLGSGSTWFVSQYTLDGVATGVKHDLSRHARCMCMVGDEIHVLVSDSIRAYDKNWTFLRALDVPSGLPNQLGIGWDGYSYWIQCVEGDTDGDGYLYNIASDGSFIDKFSNEAIDSQMEDLVFVGDKMYQAGRSTAGMVFVYDVDLPVSAIGISYKGLGLGIVDAPSDGKEYVRKDSTWNESTGIADAPIDGKSYVRGDAGWVEETAGFNPSDDNVIYGNWHFANKTTTSVTFEIDPDFEVPPEVQVAGITVSDEFPDT